MHAALCETLFSPLDVLQLLLVSRRGGTCTAGEKEKIIRHCVCLTRPAQSKLSSIVSKHTKKKHQCSRTSNSILSDRVIQQWNTKYKNTKHKLQYTVASGRQSGGCNVLARPHRLFGKQTVLLACLPMVHTLYNAIMLPCTMYSLRGKMLTCYHVQCMV